MSLWKERLGLVALVSVGSIGGERRRCGRGGRHVCGAPSIHRARSLPGCSAWQSPGSRTSMALLVHLKTVSELRGRGDRIAKVTFRGRDSPVLWGPQLRADGIGQGGEDGLEKF